MIQLRSRLYLVRRRAEKSHQSRQILPPLLRSMHHPHSRRWPPFAVIVVSSVAAIELLFPGFPAVAPDAPAAPPVPVVIVTVAFAATPLKVAKRVSPATLRTVTTLGGGVDLAVPGSRPPARSPSCFRGLGKPLNKSKSAAAA
jgi:hypothetical protein